MNYSDTVFKHVSNQNDGVLNYMWMLASKVMPYLLRLAAPLMGFIDCRCQKIMLQL